MRESEKRAHRKYNKERMKSISFRLHRESDADLIAKYEAIPDKMEFFRWALRNYKKMDEAYSEIEDYISLKNKMKKYRIVYHIFPEDADIEIIVTAESYEAACVFAKQYRREGFSIEEITC